MYLPNELWVKIWTYTAIVDKNRRKLLNEIINYNILKEIELIYSEHGVDWLHNDIVGWLNEGKGTYWTIQPKLMDFCLRNFDLEILDNDDLEKMEGDLLEKKDNVGYNLWKIYSDNLTYNEACNFKDWVLKRDTFFLNSIFTVD